MMMMMMMMMMIMMMMIMIPNQGFLVRKIFQKRKQLRACHYLTTLQNVPTLDFAGVLDLSLL